MSTTSTQIDGLELSEPVHTTNVKELVNSICLAGGRDTVSRYSKSMPVCQLSTQESLPPPILFRRNLNRQSQPRAQTQLAVAQETRNQTSHQLGADTTSGQASLRASELTTAQLDQLEQELYILLLSEIM